MIRPITYSTNKYEQNLQRFLVWLLHDDIRLVAIISTLSLGLRMQILKFPNLSNDEKNTLYLTLET